MVLVDTSIWIEHFRLVPPKLAESLPVGLVLMHPFVSGELACGNLNSRAGLLSHLNALPSAKLASQMHCLRRSWHHTRKSGG